MINTDSFEFPNFQGKIQFNQTEHQTSYKMSLPCHPRFLQDIRLFASRLAEDLQLDMKDCFQLELALDEACMNAIDHGSAINTHMLFDIEFIICSEKMIILIKDYGGKPFDPEFFERLAEKKDWGHGGRGIFIIKQIMDELMYIFNNNVSTLLCMVKYLSKPDVKDN